jgi:hypothetical protein
VARKKSAPIVHDDGKLPPPTADYVWSLYNLKLADGDEARLRNVAIKMRSMTRLQHALSIPDTYKAITKEVRTPYLRDTWHRTSTALNQRPYTVEITPRDKTNDTQRAAELGTRWDAAVRDALDKEIGENTAIESTKALIRDGESVLKLVHRPDAWATFPKREDSDGTTKSADQYTEETETYKKGSPLPFAWRVVDRLSMLFQDGEFGDEWCIEYGEYPRKYLGRQYGMKILNADSGDELLINPERMLGGMPQPQGYLVTAMGRAVKIEYFDEDWWHVVIDGADAPGFPKPNPYAPRLPYLRAKGPDSESLLYSLMFLVPALDELLTMKLNWSYLGSYPNPVISQIPTPSGIPDTSGDAGQLPKLSWRPGKETVLPPGWQLNFLSPPPIGKDLNDLVVILRDMIDVAGIPSVFRGAGGDNQAGYAINQLMAAASLSFKLAGESLSRQFERAFEQLHWMVSHIVDQTVYVLAGAGKDQEGKQWLGLRPKGSVSSTEASVEELGPVTVEFRPMLPTDEQARAMVAFQLTSGPTPLLSHRRALEKYLQIEDPDDVMDEIAIEKALSMPPLSDTILANALWEAGLGPNPNAPPPTPPQPAMSATPGFNGAAAGGLPSLPGVNAPMQPPPPGAPPIQPGRPAGAFPGSPNTPVTVGG